MDRLPTPTAASSGAIHALPGTPWRGPPAAAETTNLSPGTPSGEKEEEEVGEEEDGGRGPSDGPPRPATPPPPPAQPLPLLV